MTRLRRTGTLVTVFVVLGLLTPALTARAAEPPTGVPSTTFTITDTCQSGPDNCGGLGPGVSITSSTFIVTSSYDANTCTGTFNGTGATNGNPSQTQSIAGTVTGNKVSFTRTYTTIPGFSVTGTGAIQPDYTVSGSETDSVGRGYTFETTAWTPENCTGSAANETDLSSANAGQLALPGGHIGGANANLLGTFSDPDGSAGDFTVTVAWGGGSGTASTPCGAVAGTTTTCTDGSGYVQLVCTATSCQVYGKHDYAQAGRFTATVTATETAAQDSDFDPGATTSFSDLIYFDLYVTGNCSGAPSAAGCGTSTGPSGTTFANFTGTEGQTTVSGPVAFFTDGDFPSPSNFTQTISWGDGTTSSPSSVSCVWGCYVYGSHLFKEENTAGSPYQITVSVQDAQDAITSSDACPASTDFRSSCTPISATIADASLTSSPASSSQSCAPFTTCQVLIGSFHDNNSYCDTVPPEEAISSTTGYPHYQITVYFSNGVSGSPTRVAETASHSCTFDVYGTTTFNVGAGTSFTAYMQVCDEAGGSYNDCTSTSSSPTTIQIQQPTQPSTPCVGTACPSAEAHFSNQVVGYQISSMFSVRIVSCSQSYNGCQLNYVGAGLTYRDTSPGGLMIPSCTQYSVSCHLTITSFTCTSSSSATIFGTWTYGGVTHSFRLDLSGTSTTYGTYTIYTTTQDGTYYTYTTTGSDIVNVSCPGFGT